MGKTVKIVIIEDEWFPVLTPVLLEESEVPRSSSDAVYEVPRELVERWESARKQFESAEMELHEIVQRKLESLRREEG